MLPDLLDHRLKTALVFELGTVQHLGELIFTDTVIGHGIEDRIADIREKGTDKNVHVLVLAALLQHTEQFVKDEGHYDNLYGQESQIL